MKMYVLVLFLAAACLGEELWRDNAPTWKMLENEAYMENCKEGNDCFYGHKMVNLEGKRKADRNVRENPFFSILNTYPPKQIQVCSCGFRKQLVQLGMDYFPKFIMNLECVQGTCGEHACTPKLFDMWVLRKRRSSDLEFGSEPVPAELRNHWIGEEMQVTVGCECIP